MMTVGVRCQQVKWESRRRNMMQDENKAIYVPPVLNAKVIISLL